MLSTGLRIHMPEPAPHQHGDAVLRVRSLSAHTTEVLWCALLPEDRVTYPDAATALDLACDQLDGERDDLHHRAKRWMEALASAHRDGRLPEHLAAVVLHLNEQNHALSWLNAGFGPVWLCSGPDAEPQPHPPSMGLLHLPTGVPLQSQSACLQPGGVAMLLPPDPVAPLGESARHLLARGLALQAPASVLAAAWRHAHANVAQAPDAVIVQRQLVQTGSTEVLLELPRSCAQLTPLRTSLATLCEGMPDPFVQMLTLATFEAATNVVRHATPATHHSPLFAILQRHEDHVCVELIYEGEPYSAHADALPDFSGESKGGFGLFIIEQAVDEVKYDHYLPGFAVVRLHKHLPA